MVKRYLALLFFILLMIACQNNKQNVGVNREKYNFSIQYDFNSEDTNIQDKYRDRFNYEKLYLFIEEEFKRDTMIVFINGKFYSKQVLSSDLSTGLAKIIEIEDFETINTIGFRINNSPFISFETFDLKNNLIGIEKRNRNIDIVFYKNVPVFY